MPFIRHSPSNISAEVRYHHVAQNVADTVLLGFGSDAKRRLDVQRHELAGARALRAEALVFAPVFLLAVLIAVCGQLASGAPTERGTGSKVVLDLATGEAAKGVSGYARD